MQLGYLRRASSMTNKLVKLPGLHFSISIHGLVSLKSVALGLDFTNVKPMGP